MAGGTYHDHADMEAYLQLGALGAATVPITDAAMDVITLQTEAMANGYILRRTKGLRGIGNASPTGDGLQIMILISARIYTLRQSSRAASTSASNPQGSIAYVQDPEIRDMLETLVALSWGTAASISATRDTVDTTKTG